MTYSKTYTWQSYPTYSSGSGTDYDITWDGSDVTASTDVNWDRIIDPEPEPEILEDGPWSPLYEYEDYVGIAHAILAEELGLDEEEI